MFLSASIGQQIPDDPEKNSLLNPSVNHWSFYTGLQIPAIIKNIPVELKVEAVVDKGLLVGDQFGSLLGVNRKL